MRGSSSQGLGQLRHDNVRVHSGYVDKSAQVDAHARICEIEARFEEQREEAQQRAREIEQRAREAQQQEAHKHAKVQAELRRLQEQVWSTRTRGCERGHPRRRRSGALHADAETVKTEHDEGDVDEPDATAEDDTKPGLAADDSDLDDEYTDEENQDAPQEPVPKVYEPPLSPPPGSRYARGAALALPMRLEEFEVKTTTKTKTMTNTAKGAHELRTTTSRP